MAWNRGACYTKGDLKSRGWTDALIKQFLGEPDAVRKFRFGEAHLYAPLRVTMAEERAEVQELLGRAVLRRENAAKAILTRRANTLAKVGDVRLPAFEPEGLLEAAVNHYNIRKATWAERYQNWEGFAFLKADELCLWPVSNEFRDRICVNFLRHQATGYNYLVKIKLRGKTGRDEAWRLWWERFVEAIAKQYPYLSAETERQRGARVGKQSE